MKKITERKRFLALLLSLVMILSLFPVSAFAEDGEQEPCTHEYEACVTEPTCTEGGKTTYTCLLCGDENSGDEVPALGHDYVPTETVEPDCLNGGYTVYTSPSPTPTAGV